MEKIFVKNNRKQSKIPPKTSEQILRMCIAKTIKFITINPDSIVHIMDSIKDKLYVMMPILVRDNPYANDLTHSKVIKLLVGRCLKRNYTEFIKFNSMESTRIDMLYQYLIAIF
jgi:hypothetical protein